MRLLILVNSMGGGGAERVTATLANYWAAKGWEISIVTLTPQSDDFYELSASIKRVALELGGESSNVFIGLLHNVHRVLAVRRVLCDIKPDVALGMMTTANILLALASLRLRIRTVGSERTHPPQYPLGALWERLRSYGYGLLVAVVAQSNEGAAWIDFNTNAKNVVVIPNPVKWPLTNHQPLLEVDEVCQKGRKLLLAVGRLSAEKQFDLLIDVFKSLTSRHPDWDLVILGEGPLHLDLEILVRQLGLQSRVLLPGRAGNVGDWYERADLFVLSSRFEGFPNALVEAMAYGVPTVSFDCDTGPRDIICHEVDGLLVPPGNQVSLTAALDRLMDDAALRQRFANRAVEVRERFSIDLVAEKWANLFLERAK
ncbi:glycosyltransferase family 4 protein [Nitrosomonas supralitoralis]|nr:glycosyltransferase family 4 protein [Nitrosomonas supralitoralis]